MADNGCLLLSGAKGSYTWNHPDCGCRDCSVLSAIAKEVNKEWWDAHIDAEVEAFNVFIMNRPGADIHAT